MITPVTTTYGRGARQCLDRTRDAGPAGAHAALETFYYAFNQRSLPVMREVWWDDPAVQLNNPLGGIVRGIEAISEVYARVFTGTARVWVEFGDILRYDSPDVVMFAGRERGEFAVAGASVPLTIRTTRVFGYRDGTGWRQLHHHGSIDDPDLLRDYQRAVRSAS